jgi:hypothetical protein
MEKKFDTLVAGYVDSKIGKIALLLDKTIDRHDPQSNMKLMTLGSEIFSIWMEKPADEGYVKNKIMVFLTENNLKLMVNFEHFFADLKKIMVKEELFPK